jgi:CubicO group peptidase (beta-lactamase class C family)
VNEYGTPRLFESGEGWMYGPGLDWAGLVLGRATNSSLGKWCEEHIFKPLGMNSTTFRLLEKPQVKDRLMAMSTRKGDGTLTPGPEQTFAIDPVNEAGGVGSYSCAYDYTRVLADLLKDSPTLLKKESVDLLFTPQFAPDSAPHKALQAGRSMGMFDGMIGLPFSEPADKIQYSHGLGGLLIVEDIKTEKYLKPAGTLTWSGMPNLLWSLNREKGIGFLYATQVFPYGDPESQRLWKVFETEVWRNLG